jgi:hypothetical protein
MGTKVDDRTLARAADNEPIFVLRAQDETSDAVVLEWIQRNPHLPPYKVREAMETVLAIRAWPTRKQAD